MKLHTITLLATSLAATALSACTTPQVISSQTANATAQSYVSDDYHNRHQGYDWVAVETARQANNSLKVQIRSRIDKKKPTCTFDGIAHPISSNLYQIRQGDMTLNLTRNANSINITPAQDSNRHKAMMYCSGGGSLIGTYKQVTELDRTGLDTTKYAQTLYLQNIRFFIEHKDDAVNVRTSGLSHEFNENFTIKNQRITHADITDMNRDGYPEVLIYLQYIKQPFYGDVLAFSVNGNQSLSQMSFTPVKDHPELRAYYHGGDEFSLVEHDLVQRFPEYINGKATGYTKQVVYQVQNGEASRQLVLVK
ncbi:hypothetical protein B0681_08430 [Moraxella porci DSM 25326]|uniref:Uncharacterized protein n=1 Tax=Moraxella porci DSM 25326 TaxID=573983 RepID=A0A1T0CNS3_9GAMM|nr:hypothetical protein [Moraxella porci]OOS23974.1 hypothetical protein B0681_08430 [Moraxella porci DSM 25326]